MHGIQATATKPPAKSSKLEIITLTPELATQLLELNHLNRPLSDIHVARIARQIKDGKWEFNGDTIKIADTGDILDGQHRLWAIMEAKKPVETIIVYNIKRSAFATIDTLRRNRSGADVLALNGAHRYRVQMAAALAWLLRWQRGILEDWKAPHNRIENSDIEKAFSHHPAIVNAVERAMRLRSFANSSVVAFVYYILTNKSVELAERMMSTLEEPAGVGIDDPFFRLRAYFTTYTRRKEPLVTIALAFKAANTASRGEKIQALTWRNQGKSPEAFPALDITRG